MCGTVPVSSLQYGVHSRNVIEYVNDVGGSVIDGSVVCGSVVCGSVVGGFIVDEVVENVVGVVSFHLHVPVLDKVGVIQGNVDS